jgi:uncharacterized tellurite resistance protein B-like protein
MLSGLSRLFGRKPAAREAPAPKLAMAQLLLELVRADFSADTSEIAAVRQLLGRAYGLSEQDLDALLKEADERVARSVSLHDAVNALNAALSHEQRRELMAMLWRVAYADGKLDKYEEALLRRLADLLFVAHSDFIREKLAAIGEQGV